MRLRPLLALVAAVAFVALLGYGLVANNGAEITVGETAPDATLERLDGSGSACSPTSAASGCCSTSGPPGAIHAAPSRPRSRSGRDQHDGELEVVGVNTEDLSDDAIDFVDEFGLTWEMLRDGDGEFKDSYGIFALPESFLIDPEGHLALIRRGPSTRPSSTRA